MISKDSPKDPKDGLPMEKLVGLDPDFFYRIDEDAWAWSYDYQDNGTQYTVGEDLVNPFKFVNKPKETVREAEATVRNEFAKKSTTTSVRAAITVARIFVSDTRHARRSHRPMTGSARKSLESSI